MTDSAWSLERKTLGHGRVCDEVLEHLKSMAKSNGARNGVSASDWVLLARRVPFIGRDAIRRAVTLMVMPDGWPALIVGGPRKVGTSHCKELVTNLRLTAAKTDGLVEVILEELRQRPIALRDALAKERKANQPESTTPPASIY